jgi:xanthine dehydrogenase small subunit
MAEDGRSYRPVGLGCDGQRRDRRHPGLGFVRFSLSPAAFYAIITSLGVTPPPLFFPMRDFVLIYVNGQRCELRGAQVFQPLSTFLRSDLQLTGTKVVCAEGDCGSCTVFLGRPKNGKLQYQTVCSCIQYLYQLDSCHIVTVEGLSSEGKLNPIQEAMVRCQGTQCGYCTPGFVVSMQALFESDMVMTEQRLRRGLVGNLCRCTGYEPIFRAGLEVETKNLHRLDDLYNPVGPLAELARSADEPVRLAADGKSFFKPTTLANAAKFKSENADCVVISGGTDLGVQMNKGLREPKTIMSTAALTSLTDLQISFDQIVAGARVSIAELESAAATVLPEYAKFLAWFGSPPIKNAGTLGGNIANASPIGDSMPALFVLNASVELVGVNGPRLVNINDFYIGYKKTAAKPDELISRIVLPLPKAGALFKLYKVSKRKDLDISTFSAAIWMRLDGPRIAEVRIAYGGVGPKIMRMPQTEAHLTGGEFSEETFDSAAKIAVAEITPISDVRGSAEYRLLLAANILRKFYSDVAAPSNGDHKVPAGKNGNGRHHRGRLPE